VKVKEVGRELGVSYVLEGSVRKAGEKIRLNRLIFNLFVQRPAFWQHRKSFQKILPY
jgi:TolB-like protein